MDPSRLGTLVRSVVARMLSRRSLLLNSGVAATLFAAPLAEAKKKHKRKKKKKHCRGGCDANLVCKNGKCKAAPSVCPDLAICGPETPCGTTARGKGCTCEGTTEGNSVCINFIEDCNDFPQECTSTQDCRETVGFHFFCQAIKTCGCTMATGRCMPECDNPNP